MPVASSCVSFQRYRTHCLSPIGICRQINGLISVTADLKYQIPLNLVGIAYTLNENHCYLRSLSMSQSILSATTSTARQPATCRYPLCDCTPGQTCRLVSIDGNRALINRLMGLGVRIGAEIRVLQQRGQDVVITSTGNRIALGGIIARHLQVESLT